MWMAKRSSLLLPIFYFLLVFTLNGQRIVRAEDNWEEEKIENGTKKVIYEVELEEFIEKNHEGLQEAVQTFDPMEALDLSYSLSLLGKLNLKDGWIGLFSNFEVGGKCTLTYTDDTLTINLNLLHPRLSVDYKYFLRVGIIPSKGDVHFLLDDVLLNIIVKVDLNTFQAELEEFQFRSVRKTDIRVRGAWRIADLVRNALLKLLPKKLLVLEMEDVARVIAEKKIEDLNEHLKELMNSRQNSKFLDAFLDGVKEKKLMIPLD